MELLHKYGYSLVFSVMLLEQLGLPIPAAPILVLSGAIAASGQLSLLSLVIFATLAALVGDLVWYEIGKRKGRGVLKILCHVSLSPDSCVRKTENSFIKHGMNSLLFAKFVPGLNTIAPPMAGMFHRKFLSFIARDSIGSLVYVLALLMPGFLFEKEVFAVTDVFAQIGRTFFWLLLAGLAAWVAIKYVKLRLLQRLLYQARIFPEELYARMNAGERFTIVDLRAITVGDDGEKLPGAIRIHPEKIDESIHLLDKDNWIVMYCT
ncbi:MAG TPA: VTT domain-containing protein [Acidobacteriota bacterium]